MSSTEGIGTGWLPWLSLSADDNILTWRVLQQIEDEWNHLAVRDLILSSADNLAQDKVIAGNNKEENI